MRFGICDDSAADRRQLQAMLRDCFSLKGVKAQISLFMDARSLYDAFAPGIFDILFLDIYMPGIDGMRAAKFLRGKDRDVLLVFTTISADHAFESYSVYADGYLLKPFAIGLLDETMEWCLQNSKANLQHITIISNREAVMVPHREILYVEVFGRSCVIHTFNGPITTNRVLSELENELGGAFLRCHRSYLVNMEHILRHEAACFLLPGNRSVPIARDGANSVKQKFFDWSFRRTWEKR